MVTNTRNKHSKARPPPDPSTIDSDNDSHNGDGSGNDENHIEWLATSRSRRSTAGNRMKSLLANEDPDDDLELLFAEADNDAGFSDSGSRDSDVRMDSSSDDDDDDNDKAVVDELEGEKELEREARQQKQAARKRKAAMSHIPAKFRKKPRIQAATTTTTATGSGSVRRGTQASKASSLSAVARDSSVAADSPPTPLTPGDPDATGRQSQTRRKSERQSWLPAVADMPTRSSKRETTMLSKEQLHAQMEAREARRVKQLKLMQEKAKRADLNKKKPLTQEDRLREAAVVEERNAKSLNRWEETERVREAERMRKLAALHSRKLDGPVISFWSGVRDWADGKTKAFVEMEVRKPRKKREKIIPGGAVGPGLDDSTTLISEQEQQLPSATSASATASALSNSAGGVAVMQTSQNHLDSRANLVPCTSATTTSAPPVWTPSIVAATTAPNAAHGLSGWPMTPTAAPGSIAALRRLSMSNVPTASSPLTMPPMTPATITTPVAELNKAAPSANPASTPVTSPAASASASASASALVSLPTPAPAPVSLPTLAPAPVVGSPPPAAGQVALSGSPVTSMPTATAPVLSPERQTQKLAQLPRLEIPTADPKQFDILASKTGTDIGVDVTEDKSPQEEEKSTRREVRRLIILQGFDPEALKDKTVQMRLLFNKKMTKLPKPPPPLLCAITNHPARYRDPLTGLPYRDTHAFKLIRRLYNNEFKFSGLVGAYVGSQTQAADGVPARFMDPAARRTYPKLLPTLPQPEQVEA